MSNVAREKQYENTLWPISRTHVPVSLAVELGESCVLDFAHHGVDSFLLESWFIYTLEMDV